MARILIVDDNMDLGGLLARAFGERGHTTELHFVGRDGLVAMQTSPLDAAVVDLHLPDIPGAELLKTLSDAGIPTVVVSGVFKGPAFEAELRAIGARALFAKPFDLQEVVSTVEALLRPEQMPAEPQEEPELLLTEAVDSEPQASSPEAARAVEVEREAARRRTALGDLPFSNNRQVWDGSGPARPLSGAVRAFVTLGPDAQPLAQTSVPRLLAAAHQGKVTGELRLKRGPVVKVIWLEGGRPVFAASNVAAERFGRYVVARGDVAATDLLTVQEVATRDKIRTGDAMIRLGLLSPERRLQLLHDQAQEIVWSTFDWSDGEHQFITRRVGRPDVVPLELSLAPLVLKGFERLPLVRLRERVPAKLIPSPAPDPAFDLNELELTAPQARLVMAADGTKLVEDLVALADMPERETLALVFTLLELRFLEPRAASPSRRIVLV